MLPEELNHLIEKYLNGTASEKERQQVLQWYRSVDHSKVDIEISSSREMKEIRQRMLLNLRSYAQGDRVPVVRRLWMRRWISAAAVILIGVGSYIMFSHPSAPSVAVIHPPSAKIDIAPGHYGATLNLSDGSAIQLDSTQDGIIGAQDKMRIVKENGKIKYIGTATEMIYNNVSTARGRQWQLTLPDETRVWLNAESSIHYPLAFTGKERLVEITGEAYFEVVHNAAKPFRVKVRNQVIEDIGTAFNINAYTDEPDFITTLAEGSARVTKGLQSVVLKQGQQAVAGKEMVVRNGVDIASVLAWKNGSFQFRDASLQDVMRQISRWYDVAVEYQGDPRPEHFTGKIPRNMVASKVLDILQQAGVHFTITAVPEQGKEGKIIVTP